MKCPRCLSENHEDSRYCSKCGAPIVPSGEIAADFTRTLRTPAQVMTPGKIVAGKYMILEEIGRGGMGVVYKAEDTSLERKVAIKFLPEETSQDPKARSRLIREAKAAAALDHPYICGIYEVGEEETRPFFAMEYVPGKTLRERLAQGPLPLKQALEYAVEIAEALEAAHDKRIIHRDIKPANIMLMDTGHAKVMDFGLAKHVSIVDKEGGGETSAAILSNDGAAIGTPAYMSPEQLNGMPLDPRTDIFSFGIVLYEMLGGAHPFLKKTGLTTVSAILSQEPQPIAALAPGFPEPLQKIVDKLLAKDPDRRYPSMKDVRADLKTAIAESAPAPKIAKAIKPLRLALTGIVVVAAVLTAAWLSSILFFRSPAEALAFQERDWILILDFDNQTGDPVFDGSLMTAMTVGIQQSQYVNVFPPSRIQETLRRMRRADVKRADEAVGREIALREGIKGLLSCGIDKVGESYLLTAKIVDPDRQTAVFSDSSRAADKNHVLESLDVLAEKVRRALGESMGKISEKRIGLTRATTSSLEALKSYMQSQLAAGDTGVQLLKQALELDPDFALAHAEMGMKYYVVGNRADGEKHFQKALSLLDRLTEREKLWIRAIVEDWRGNRDQGIRNYKAYLAEYPDDFSAWWRLGYAYLVSNQLELGVEAYKKVISLDPGSPGAYVNLASCLNALKRDEEAVVHYQKAFSLDLSLATGQFVNGEYGFLLVRMGKIEEAGKTFDQMVAQPDNTKKARGLRSRGLLQMYQGRYSNAQESLKEAVLLNRTLKAQLSEIRDRIFLAINHNLKEQSAAFEREMAAIQAIQKEINIEPSFLFKIGKIYARIHRLQEAGRLLEILKSRVGDVLAASGIGRSNQRDQASFLLLKGEIALAEKKFEEAIDSLTMAANLDSMQLTDSLAYAYLKSGNVDKAIEKYLAFTATDVLGYEGQESWILAHYELGKLYERKGDAAEARKHYERFLSIWDAADPDLSEPQDARNRLASLKRP